MKNIFRKGRIFKTLPTLSLNKSYLWCLGLGVLQKPTLGQRFGSKWCIWDVIPSEWWALLRSFIHLLKYMLNLSTVFDTLTHKYAANIIIYNLHKNQIDEVEFFWYWDIHETVIIVSKGTVYSLYLLSTSYVAISRSYLTQITLMRPCNSSKYWWKPVMLWLNWI